MEPENTNKKPMNTSVAIIIAGVCVALAILGSQFIDSNKKPTTEEKVDTNNTAEISPITGSDHIRGNPNANVAIIEYSDTDCPFCKEFHSTMKQVVSEDDDILWVYRHLPLTGLHPRAGEEAHASECVAALLGEDMFWSYLDSLFVIESSKNPEDTSTLRSVAVGLGANASEFDSCMSSNKYKELIEMHSLEARNAGGEGTPFSVIMSRSGKRESILGSQPIEAIRSLVESVRN